MSNNIAQRVLILCILTQSLNAERKPNIVVFIADDLGYADLGCYGNTTLRTPNIDSLARDGVRLTHQVATASVCTPSRAALLTGRHQMRSGLAPSTNIRINFWVASRGGLPPSEITFAELTEQAGYRNALIGKWHLGNHRDRPGDHAHHPLSQGFHYFYGLLGTNFDDFANDGSKVVLKQRPYFNIQILASWLSIVACLIYAYRAKYIGVFLFAVLVFSLTAICWYPYYIMNNLYFLNSMLHRNHDIVEQPAELVGLSKRLVHEGLEFITNSTGADSPFLLVMSFVHVHTVLRVSRDWDGSSAHGIFGDAVQEMDWSVGQILDALDSSGQRDNTLVYFTSDHGAHKELGVHGGCNGVFKGGKAHGAPEGGIRVPGIFRWPAVLPAGRTVDAPVSLMDLFPLVAKAAGIALPDDRVIDGHDILPLLKGESDVTPHEFMFHYCGSILAAVRYIPKTGGRVWKQVSHVPNYFPGTDVCRFGCRCDDLILQDPPLIYDVISDPSESHPIDSLSKEYADISKKVEAAVKIHKASLEPVESMFSYTNVLWRYPYQECCNGTFPFNCQCSDSKYPSEFYI
ncbi:steryl-sulfatase-like [Mya arenaria]|uniref:steryl-sulfatase-like n=1 Tax=Mya arenaria TaxID=6604 RepID=UPI0022E81115|nr:steryl-sulfatase-like [Mya arenaria]